MYIEVFFLFFHVSLSNIYKNQNHLMQFWVFSYNKSCFDRLVFVCVCEQTNVICYVCVCVVYVNV